MVIVDTTFTRIQELIKKDITLEELEQVLADMGLELDDVVEDQIKVEITAERIDLISPEGLSRAINSYLGLTKEYDKVEVKESDYIHVIEPSVKEVRASTRSFVVKNLSMDDEDIKSLMWIQEKIHDTYGRKRKKVAVGVYDLNLIKFPITYKAEKPEDIKFVPLEMTQEMSANQILEEHPKGKTYAHLLQGKNLFPLHRDADNQVLSMPPIINSDSLGKITTATKDIFVECTGPSEEALDSIMDILATMFSDWQAEIYSVKIKDGDKEFVCPEFKETSWKLPVNLIKNLIGINLNSKQVAELLPKMQYDVTDVNEKEISVTIPSVRTDIWHPVDIADDVARAYGYNNITPTVPNLSTIGKMIPTNILKEDLANFLVGLELIELNTWALTNHLDQYEKMNISEHPHIKLGKNTQDSELSMVRSWLIPEAIKALVANRSREYPQRVFELGIVVEPDGTKDVKCRNVEKLVVLLCEDKVDYTKIRQVLHAIMQFLGLEYEVKEQSNEIASSSATPTESQHGSFIEGRVGDVYVDGKKVGLIGEIHPQVLDNWDLRMPLVSLEINIEKLK